MVNEFYTELTCGFTGGDCEATAAWLEAALRQQLPGVAARVEAFYTAAPEALRYAVGEACGWCVPSPRNTGPTLLPRIAADFNAMLEAANGLIGE